MAKTCEIRKRHTYKLTNQHEFRHKLGMISGASEGLGDPASHVVSVVFLVYVKPGYKHNSGLKLRQLEHICRHGLIYVFFLNYIIQHSSISIGFFYNQK